MRGPSRNSLACRLSLVACAVLAPLTPSLLGAQALTPRDSARVLLVEHRFDSDSSQIVVELERHVVYWVEVTGPGTLEIRLQQRRPRPVQIVPIVRDAAATARDFEVYPGRTGSHVITLSGRPEGASATLKLYRDEWMTRAVGARRHWTIPIGLQIAAGLHSGYRFDPTSGPNPAGGGDLEGCLLIEQQPFGTCVGVGRQWLPDAGYAAMWLFVEQRVRVVTRQMISDRRTELSVVGRLGQATATGPRQLNPRFLAVGLQVAQFVARENRRGGLRVLLTWLHTRLFDAPETELLNAERLAVGVAWML